MGGYYDTPPIGALCFVLASHVTAVTCDQFYVDFVCLAWYYLWGGEKMKTVVRFQLTFSPKTAEKLQKLAADKGLSKSALVAVAVDKLWKEERPDEE